MNLIHTTNEYAVQVARYGLALYGERDRFHTEWAYYDGRTKRYMNGSDYIARMAYVEGRNVVRFDRDRSNVVDVPWREIPFPITDTDS